MKYLVVVANEKGILEWNIVNSKVSLAGFIKTNYKDLIISCGYSWKEVSKHLQIFEIEPCYEVLTLLIEKPKQFEISINDWR